MTSILIGHRGVGKTTLLKRLATYGFKVIDLDDYIEKREGVSLAEIFSSRGEECFRLLEKKYFIECMVVEPDFISLGAGFNFDLPKSVNIIWVSRCTDKSGRIFMNRPRLDASLSPLGESLKYFNLRDKRYSELCHQVYVLPEGLETGNIEEKKLLGGGELNLGAAMAVPARVFESKETIDRYFDLRRMWGVTFFELRNDLLGEEHVSKALSYISGDQVLFSIRKKIEKLPLGITRFDWALELGECPIPNPYVFSLHLRNGEITLAKTLVSLEKYEKSGALLKLAVEIKSHSELILGHEWQRENPAQRTFLPMSKDGAWRWYRILQKGKQKLNFVNEGFSSVQDQPHLMEWLTAPVSEEFAAVLGDPIEQSYSPEEHKDFFSKRGLPFVRINVNEKTWSEASTTLSKLGLRYAAVTSPLKKAVLFPETVNTLYSSKSWQGTNTDIIGLKEIFEEIKNKDVAVWGGCGLLESIREVLPNAKFYSTTSGQERNGLNSNVLPEVLVWAVGRNRVDKFPPDNWRPKLVLDLNYTEDSPGKEYALGLGCQYEDGKRLFRAQAKAQREFWRQCEGRGIPERSLELS